MFYALSVGNSTFFESQNNTEYLSVFVNQLIPKNAKATASIHQMPPQILNMLTGIMKIKDAIIPIPHIL
jgi:hypothetical protein